MGGGGGISSEVGQSGYWKHFLLVCLTQLLHCVFVIAQNDKSDDILAALLSCDIIIYHVTGLNSQVEEALWAVECMFQNF